VGCAIIFIYTSDPRGLGNTHRSNDCADEVNLSRKGAKSRTRITSLRSKTRKARTHVERLRAANADLKKKLAEALEQQTATSEVLRVISSSPGELAPVFSTMLGNALRICEARFGTLYLCEGDGFRAVAMHNAPPAYAEARSSLGRAAKTKQAAHLKNLFQQTVRSKIASAVMFSTTRGTRAVVVLGEAHLHACACKEFEAGGLDSGRACLPVWDELAFDDARHDATAGQFASREEAGGRAPAYVQMQ
jgi:hypothetical protein